MKTNSTHDSARKSWLASANEKHTDFPIQNLPHGVFRRRQSKEEFRGGIAIGDQILDLRAAVDADLFTSDVLPAAQLAATAPLNRYMAMDIASRHDLRKSVSDLLSDKLTDSSKQKTIEACLIAQADAEMALPSRVENFSDFYSSISHATNVGRLFRPDNPILPNYRWLPVAYHGRTSSIRVSGNDFRRPSGQLKNAADTAPEYLPCRRLDYEAELGFLIGEGNELGEPIDINEVDDKVFGVCLLNDWSARDIQSWEYQPLGPFLAKSFFTSLSPWAVTMEALEPFRCGFERDAHDIASLPHLTSKNAAVRGSIDIRVQTFLQTAKMRNDGLKEVLVSTSSFTDAYWSMAQLIAHQTSNGCNLMPGDLMGSGTLSGPAPSSHACLLELTEGGKKPLVLTNGEQRTFLEDGDTVIMRGYCEAEGRVRIGFGECRATVLPAKVSDKS